MPKIGCKRSLNIKCHDASMKNAKNLFRIGLEEDKKTRCFCKTEKHSFFFKKWFIQYGYLLKGWSQSTQKITKPKKRTWGKAVELISVEKWRPKLWKKQNKVSQKRATKVACNSSVADQTSFSGLKVKLQVCGKSLRRWNYPFFKVELCSNVLVWSGQF